MAERGAVNPEQRLASAAAFAFVGSGCLLVLEIVAARLVAPAVGVSLYTWTSVIGVVLGGVSLGNFLGGRIADRWPNRSVLAILYLAGAGASLAVLGAVHYAGSFKLPESAPAFLQVLWLTAVLFLVPSTVLATPTPLLTRLALQSVDHTGRVVGRIQAGAALGSIVGTFLTGFLLISWFGTRHVVAGIAATMLLLAVLGRPPWAGARAVELAALALVIVAVGWASHSPCTRESNYYCISVTEGVQGTTPVRFLNLDRLLDSIVDINNPANALYSYELDYANAIGRLHRPGSRIDTLLLGGGGYSVPRYLEHVYRGSVTVAEIDPGVTAVARKYLRYRDTPRVDIVHDDARRVLRRMPADRRFDLILGDTFNDFQVPYHLTTRQFHELVSRHLKPGGIYMLNLVDGVHDDFLRSEIRTLREVFPYVGLITQPGNLQSGRRFTYVVVAANAPPAKPLATIPQADLDAFLANGHSVVLTDDHVPVDQLLAPVFAQLLNGNG